MQKSLAIALALFALTGCGGSKKEEELVGHYYGDVIPSTSLTTKEADFTLMYMRGSSVFLYRPNKFRFESPGHSWRGTYKVEGDLVTLTTTDIDGESPQSWKRNIIEHNIKTIDKPENLMLWVEWMTNPIKLKVSDDKKRLERLGPWQGTIGDFYYEKRK